MDIWQRAKIFAEEAAKKSQELTQGIASTNFSDVVSEASKRSKELAAEASKMSQELASEALKRADEIKAQIPPAAVVLNNLVDSAHKGSNDPADLEKYGVTDDLREFVKGITTNTFRDFPIEDDSEMSDIPTVSNVRQDLTDWQERHAKLVLLSVKEISKLRYQLCPRVMKERKFWRIYFILVNSHVAPFPTNWIGIMNLKNTINAYGDCVEAIISGKARVAILENAVAIAYTEKQYEKRYMEDIKLKAAEKVKDSEVKEISPDVRSEKTDKISKPKSNNVKPAAAEQDLDVFLLGDLEDSDDGPDDGKDGIDDDFDKL